MSSSGRSPVHSHRAAGRPERLLRASVTAFSSSARPTRREIAQLDDLAVPLLGSVSDDCLRYVAAALSESPFAPPVLVRRLADQPVDISAPLLMRSPLLSAIDLVALIGRHGAAHARAIAARRDLDERIRRLIRSIGALDDVAEAAPPTPPDPLEETREQLRAMMRPAGIDAPAASSVRLRWDGEPGVYRKLRSTALAGAPALFHTALADALGIDFSRAREIADARDASGLMIALKSLSLSEEEAFLIVQCASPGRHLDIRAVAGFLDAYAVLDTEAARETVAGWRGKGADDIGVRPADGPVRDGILRAS